MKFATVRELSQNASKFVHVRGPVIITRHGKPVRAMIPMDEEGLEDFILAQKLDLAGDLEKAFQFSRRGKNIPAARLKARFQKQLRS